jgi:hypothetical protein
VGQARVIDSYSAYAYKLTHRYFNHMHGVWSIFMFFIWEIMESRIILPHTDFAKSTLVPKNIFKYGIPQSLGNMTNFPKYITRTDSYWT